MVTLPQINTFDVSLKGTNSPTYDEIRRGRVYSGEHSRGVDVTIILGMFNDSMDCDNALLVMRFHKLMKKEMKSIKKQQIGLFQCVLNLIAKGGYEAKRTGGSSGLTRINSDLFSFMNVPGNFPVKGKSIKVLRKKLTFECFYISRMKEKAGTFVKVIYSQPKVGGSFHLPFEVLSQFRFLKKFILSKVMAAMILKYINDETYKKVQVDAVANELSNVKLPLNKQNPTEFDEMIQLYNTFNKFTLVTHPVGYHLDVFSEKKPSLENKMCFIHTQKREMVEVGQGTVNMCLLY